MLVILYSSLPFRLRRRGRQGSYPPCPRTDHGVRNYRTALFRDTRFRMALTFRRPSLFPALRFAPVLMALQCPCRCYLCRLRISVSPFPLPAFAFFGYYELIRLPTGLRLSYSSFRSAYHSLEWNPSDLPSSCAFLLTHATLFVDPGRPSENSPFALSLCWLLLR